MRLHFNGLSVEVGILMRAHRQPQLPPKRWTWRWSGCVALAPGQQPGRGDRSLLTPSLEPISPCPQPPATLAAHREFAFVVFVTSAGVLGRATLRERFGGGARSEPGAVENPGAPGASRAATATSLVQKRSRDTRQHVAGGSPCARLRANHRVGKPGHRGDFLRGNLHLPKRTAVPASPSSGLLLCFRWVGFASFPAAEHCFSSGTLGNN